MEKIFLLGVALVILLAGTGTVSAILNGGFEAPEVTNSNGWDVFYDATPGLEWHVELGLGSPDPVPTTVNPTLELQKSGLFSGFSADEGNQYAELDSYGNVNISQMVSTTAGTMYSISFAQACRSDGGENPSLLGVYWGDTYLGQTSCTQALTWVTHSYSVTAATTGQIKLMFVDEGPSNQYGVLLDHVIVKEKGVTPVPEFPFMALPVALIVGLIGAVLFIKSTKES